MIKEWLRRLVNNNVVQGIGIMAILMVLAYLIGLMSLSIMLQLYGLVYHAT
mgnify:FL=1